MGVCYHAHARFLDRRGNRITVPAPVDHLTPDAPWCTRDRPQIGGAAPGGFTAILFPPPEKTQSGAANTGDGYGAYDQYDLGSKDQCFSVPTRFGSRERLQRAIAIAHACGLDAYTDFVMHQVIGGSNGVYRYLGADGQSRNGRFPKDPGCFRGNPPRRPEDPVPVPADDFAFGDEFVYKELRSAPLHNRADDRLGDWLVRTLDVQGGRVDDTKGAWAAFVAEWMNSRAMAGKFFVSEYFEGNPASLQWWAHSSPMNGRSTVFDFTLHWALQGICNGMGEIARWTVPAIRRATRSAQSLLSWTIPIRICRPANRSLPTSFWPMRSSLPSRAIRLSITRTTRRSGVLRAETVDR